MLKPRKIDNVFPSIAKATFNSRILLKQTIDDGLNIVQTAINDKKQQLKKIQSLPLSFGIGNHYISIHTFVSSYYLRSENDKKYKRINNTTSY